MTQVIHQQFAVSFSFPVVFTRGVFQAHNPALRDVLREAVQAHPHPRLLLAVEQAVAEAFPGLANALAAYGQAHLPALEVVDPPLVMRGGETVKNDAAAVGRIIERLAGAGIDRHSFVMAVGGGAWLDAVGYAASLVHRGVRLIRLPTTVLAQNDSGVGVKTAVNHAAGKNFIGTFAPPFAVINDADFLATLPDEHWRGGVAEAFKVAMIKDADFFAWLCAQAAALAQRDEAAMGELVRRCAALHLEHIRSSGDPFEQGAARPLDYGHWSAHQLEAMSGYAVSHGHAVAIGIMLDALYAARAGWLESAAADRLYAGLTQAGFVLWHEALEIRDAGGARRILEGLERFREHLGGDLCVTFPQGVGRAREEHAIDPVRMESACVALQARAAAVAR